MIDVIDKYIEDGVRRHGMCVRYARKAKSCGSKKQLIDTALSIQGIEYLHKSMIEGYGLPKEVLLGEFGQFANGRYIHQSENGYTSGLFIDMEAATIGVTGALVVDCKTIVIPKNHVCEIYIVGDEPTIINEGGVYTIHKKEKA